MEPQKHKFDRVKGHYGEHNWSLSGDYQSSSEAGDGEKPHVRKYHKLRTKVFGFWENAGKHFPMLRSAVTIETLVKRDIQDVYKHPEIGHVAEVRRGLDLSSEEQSFLSARKLKVRNSFAQYLGLNPQDVHLDDLPVIAFGGSGGGYRAMIGTLAYCRAMKSSGLWDVLSYVSGVSGSCWALAAYYSFGQADMDKVISHCKLRLSPHHPLSPKAIRTLLTSPGGSYATLGPLIQKKQSGLENVAMDLYSVFTSGYLFLQTSSKDSSKSTRAGSIRSSDHNGWYKWSSAKNYLQYGAEPLPILTAVRHERPWKEWVSEKRPFDADNVEATLRDHKASRKAWFQWFELSPFEVGCDELKAWCPTWAFGRQFSAGRSTTQLPEQSLALLLGLCTSAPAGPLTSYLATFKRSLPSGSVGGTLHTLSNHLEKMWGAQNKERFQQHHPLQACIEHNFLHHCTNTEDGQEPSPGIESSPYIQLIDSGLDNNCPTYVMLHSARKVDVIINMDASSDVLQDSFPARVEQIGYRRGIKFSKRENTKIGEHQKKSGQYEGFYAQIYDGLRCQRPPTVRDSYGHSVPNPPAPICEHDSTMIYMPLLPNQKAEPGFDPSTAKFSGSYNLVWTADQIDTLSRVCTANFKDGEPTIKATLREVYDRKRADRLKPKSPGQL